MADLFNNQYWFKADKGQAHEAVFEVVNKIVNDSYTISRFNDFSKYARLYGGVEVPSTFGYNYASGRDGTNLTYNVIKSCADTLVSHITQQSPSIMFLTDGEDWFKQEKAKDASKYVNAAFYATQFKQKAKRAFLHGCIFGKGCLKVIADKNSNQLVIEEVVPFEILVDSYDALYGKPTQIFQRKVISKDALKAAYPKFKNEIDMAKLVEGATQKLVPQIEVVEAFKLPSSKKAKDGKHVICINGATLYEEEWDKDYLPYIFFDLTDPLMGFWPDGLGQMLIGIQKEINKTLKAIRRIMEYSVPKLVIPQGSSVSSQQISNAIMDIIKVSGGKSPAVMQLATANPQLFQYLGQLYNKAYELAGISELSAQAKKPGGLNSGRAIRNFYQIESNRYAVTEQKWEDLFVDGAKLILKEVQYLEEDKFRSINKDGVKTLSWKEIDLKDEDYKIQAFPISALPKTPAGRLEKVTELIQAGYITREQGLELLNYPDIERVTQLELGHRRLVRKVVDKIMNEDEYTSPELFYDLDYCLEYTQQVYTLAKINNAPEEKLNLLVRFMEESKNMQKQLIPPQMALPQGIPSEMPRGKPANVPETDLLPQKTPQGPIQPPTGGVKVPPLAVDKIVLDENKGK